ncbi:OPT superfamily oligopeptide transporter [Fistulina hepatica ATCC 64428]|nr:OPT superfamily oligopeptide transporter [Fistulina hepatica ATCC 64428]
MPSDVKDASSDVGEATVPLSEEKPSSAKNLDQYGEVYEDVRAIDVDANGKERAVESDLDWSVRLVSLEDDPSLPVWTFRLWFLALGLSCFGAVLCEIFAFRPTTIYVSQLFLQTFSFILGRAMAAFIPSPHNPYLRTSESPLHPWLNAFNWWLNPGPFNIKEHCGILIMSAAATHGALAINIFAADDLFYNVRPNTAVAIFTLLASQLLVWSVSYGSVGMMRSFLVYPTACVFPNLMPTVQMFDLLHRGRGNVLQMKRLKFFWCLFVFAFVWEWLPEYIAPTLTGVSIMCLAARDSAWVTRIFGGAAGNEGLGLFSLCFEYNYVGSGGSAYGALFQPLQTQMSQYVGVLISILAFVGVYANNVWKAQNFPFLSQLLFYENGTEYDQLLILNDDYTLNTTKLAEQGLPWFTATQTVTKIGTSLSFGATITHILIWNWRQIWESIKHSKVSHSAHYEKMKAFKEVPFWWYLTLFVMSIAMGLATNYTGDSELSWWAFFIAVAFATFFLPIISFLYAVLCYVPNTEDIARMLCAAMVPGNPRANMYFTLYAYNSTEQGRSMTRDLKMGQYVKLPPRVTFTILIQKLILISLLNYLIMRTVVNSHREILLSVQGTNVWSGATIQSFNSDAIGWGALGKYLYSPHSRYGIVPLSIMIGLFVPVPFWLLHRRFPKWHLDQLITPMLCVQIGYFAGGINSSVFMTFLLCIFSQYYLRKYRPRFFRKYNFLISAALDGGTEVMVFVYSFAVGGAGGKSITMPTWALNPTGNPDYCKRLT